MVAHKAFAGTFVLREQRRWYTGVIHSLMGINAADKFTMDSPFAATKLAIRTLYPKFSHS